MAGAQRKSRKARSVTIATLSAMALVFQGCGEEDEEAYCVDQLNQVVENQNCSDDEVNNSGLFFWYFAGSGVDFDRKRVRRGSRLPTGGERIAPSNTAALQSKGGFGSSARSSGVGRSVSGGG
jgi:hypothetical protein